MALLRLDLLLELEADQSDHAAEDYRREHVTAGGEGTHSPHPPKTSVEDMPPRRFRTVGTRVQIPRPRPFLIHNR